jgi:hypothetical protein
MILQRTRRSVAGGKMKIDFDFIGELYYNTQQLWI